MTGQRPSQAQGKSSPTPQPVSNRKLYEPQSQSECAVESLRRLSTPGIEPRLLRRPGRSLFSVLS
jgi:hypothetical protein